VEQGTVGQTLITLHTWKTKNGSEVVKKLSNEEKDGLRCNSIQAGTYVVYHEQRKTGKQGNDIKTNINKNVDLVAFINRLMHSIITVVDVKIYIV
jgi:hypothetical protein